MDPQAVLAAHDEQVRRGTVEDGWRGVTWSDLSADTADAAIAEQVRRFAGTGSWEWKHYSHDEPADLPDRLVAAGFRPEPAETLLVAEIADLALDVPPPAGVDLVEVVDARGAAALVSVHDAVFGGDHSVVGRSVLARRSTVAAVVAVAGDRAVSAGRVEFCAGTDFAGLRGGGTLPEWRGRGLFRALVAGATRSTARRTAAGSGPEGCTVSVSACSHTPATVPSTTSTGCAAGAVRLPIRPSARRTSRPAGRG
ncbi:MAG: hypothetical protein J0I49_23130 [Pseudonocardia sp.]|uniref:hypothetical protein n=1 Tax=Pseudonocardia sp. TaxID=60912 RepID=UPI001ACF3DA3|nr:hypothetical protein [Pseudonocardia sp.]MBN9100979.1 hypothetical protein [Pseudonocardia sp.]